MSINIDISVLLLAIVIGIFLLIDSLNQFTITKILLLIIFVIIVSTIILCVFLLLSPFIISLLIIALFISLFQNKK